MRTRQFAALITLLCLSCDSVENRSIQKEEAMSNDDPTVIYNKSGMKDVIVKQGIPYRDHADSSLVLDIYYPPGFTFESKVPAIVIVFGYTDKAQNRIIGKQFKKWSVYTSWCRLIAASGIAAIVYETLDPVEDLAAIEKYIKENQKDLLIDKDRMGVFAVSANTPTAISRLLDESNDFFTCGVFYYGFTLTFNSKYLNPIDSLYKNWGFSIGRIPDSAHWNLDAPIMLVRAGRDKLTYLNQTIDEFVDVAGKKNLPLTLINYSNGRHGFDGYDDNDTTRMIVKSTLEFWKFYLHIENCN